MANEIQEVFIDAFRGNLRHLSQQKASKLRPYVDYFSAEAETGSWDRLSDADMVTKTRNQVTGDERREWSRRMAIATTYKDHEMIEVEDPSMMLQDPKSNLNQSMGYAAGRQIDDVIIAASTGAATAISRAPLHPAGDGTTTPTAVALPADQVIDGSGGGLTFELVTETQERFMLNDIDADIPKIFVVSPRQVRELMNLTENTSADYVEARRLQQYGICPNWLGFTWIVSNRLGGAAGSRTCFAMTHDAVGLHMPGDIEVFCQQDPGYQYAWRPYMQMNLGAVRVEDEKVVQITVDDDTST